MKTLFQSLLTTLCLIVFLPLANASGVVKAGQFEGRSDHVTSGGVAILTTEGQTLLVSEAEFFLDGAPDPQIGFGNNGFNSDTIIFKLRDENGAKVCVIPSTIDVSKFNEVYICCQKFDIPSCVAKISS
jgi:hypothetical protein